MYVVQGATYNHNHANGMSVELYGAGTVMGIDPGKGLTYEAPMHVNYYAQWAAHNTVVSGGASGPVPLFKGGGGSKNMGAIKLAAMEPGADREAVSPYCSFTDTRYTDPSSNTPQQRTLAIIRTGERSGYYVDIYRSAHPQSNEYMYHNVGDQLQFLQPDRTVLSMKPATFPLSKNPSDPPGFRLIEHFASSGTTDKGAIALFSQQEPKKYMQVLFAPQSGREFWAGSGPPSGTADPAYRNRPTPTLVCRQEGEAWKRPFVTVYEPFSGEGNFTVESISLTDQEHPEDFVALQVDSKSGNRQIILQSFGEEKTYDKNSWSFKGNFGVIGLQGEQLQYLYLGSGGLVSYKHYQLSSKTTAGAAFLQIDKNILTISCNQETTIGLPPAVQHATLNTSQGKKALPLVRSNTGVSITMPPVQHAQVQLD